MLLRQTTAHVKETRLEHNSSLDIYHEPAGIRVTSIICTIGPRTSTVEMLTQLREAGMNVVRLNFSHGSYEFHGNIIKNTRESERLHPGFSQVAIALDTKGPEIRTGVLKVDEVTLEKGKTVIISTNKDHYEGGDENRFFVDYPKLPQLVPVGGLIYVDDGLISLKVQEKGDDWVRVEIINSGKLGSRKGVNLPNTNVDLPAVSEKDAADLRWGVEQGVDMVFASFIRSAADVRAVREALGEKGKNIKIISKIENHQGIVNYDEILEASDGIMAARGDLGIEIPAHKVFLAQKMMTSRCNIVGKPLICATQMLESMTYNPRPTRAEVSDVANAVLDGADCVMLSGESAKGIYPLETVRMMDAICREAESGMVYKSIFKEQMQIQMLRGKNTDYTETCAIGAVSAVYTSHLTAIVCLTTSGESARCLSKYRPPCPILVVTRDAQTARQVHLYRGCVSILYPEAKPVDNAAWQDDVDKRIHFALDIGKKRGILASGDRIVAIQGWRGGVGNTNTFRLLPVP